MTIATNDPLVRPRAQFPLNQPPADVQAANATVAIPWGVQFARPPIAATPPALPAGLRLCPDRQVTVGPDGQPFVRTSAGTLRSDRTKENGDDRNIEREDEYTD